MAVQLLKEEIRYPVEGDKFFVENGHQDEIAWLNKAYQEFGSYADSYQTGAISLLDAALSDRKLRDYHIYPAVFLIRHYLELRLKELIQGLNYCKEQNRSFPQHHKITLLWTEFKKGYSQIGEDSNNEHFKLVGELIDELASVDPISMAFRYPVDKAGNKTQKLEYINLTNLRETFIRVSFVFDAVAMQIAHYVDMTEAMMHDVYLHYWEG